MRDVGNREKHAIKLWYRIIISFPCEWLRPIYYIFFDFVTPLWTMYCCQLPFIASVHWYFLFSFFFSLHNWSHPLIYVIELVYSFITICHYIIFVSCMWSGLNKKKPGMPNIFIFFHQGKIYACIMLVNGFCYTCRKSEVETSCMYESKGLIGWTFVVNICLWDEWACALMYSIFYIVCQTMWHFSFCLLFMWCLSAWIISFLSLFTQYI